MGEEPCKRQDGKQREPNPGYQERDKTSVEMATGTSGPSLSCPTWWISSSLHREVRKPEDAGRRCGEGRLWRIINIQSKTQKQPQEKKPGVVISFPIFSYPLHWQSLLLVIHSSKILLQCRACVKEGDLSATSAQGNKNPSTQSPKMDKCNHSLCRNLILVLWSFWTISP